MFAIVSDVIVVDEMSVSCCRAWQAAFTRFSESVRSFASREKTERLAMTVCLKELHSPRVPSNDFVLSLIFMASSKVGIKSSSALSLRRFVDDEDADDDDCDEEDEYVVG